MRDNGITSPHAYAGKRVLITGGLGLIGSTLARRLVAHQAQVTLVDSLIPEFGGNLFNVSDIRDSVTINISDIRDEHSLRQLVKDKHYIFSLAAQTSHLGSMEDPCTDLDINCRAQLLLLEACRRRNGDAKIVFASSRQVYGRPDRLPVDEGHAVRPVDVNGIHKAAAEWYHILYGTVYGIRACVLRLTNVYGPGMRIRDARQTFIGIWVRRVLEGQPFEVWGGDQLRDFTFVDDAADAFLAAGAADRSVGKIYNVGGSEPLKVRELADMVVAVNGKGTYIVREFPAERQRIDIGDYYTDDRLLRTEIGWTPRTSLRQGLERTIRFYREHLAHFI